MDSNYIISVRQLGVQGAEGQSYREVYYGTREEVERRASNVWSFERYDGCPDRYRLYVYQRGSTKALMTIG